MRLKTFAGVVQRTPLPRRDRRRKSIHRAYGLVRSSLGRAQRQACPPRKSLRHRRTTAHRHATHKIPAPPTRGRAGSVHSGPEILRPISRPRKRFANESKRGDRSCPGIVRISTIASQRSGTILILLPPWIVPMLNVGARSRVSGKCRRCEARSLIRHVAVTCANRVASQRGYSTTRPYLAITMTCPLIEG